MPRYEVRKYQITFHLALTAKDGEKLSEANLVEKALSLTGKLNPDVKGADAKKSKELLLEWARGVVEAAHKEGVV